MKRISVCYWMIFNRNDDGTADDSPRPQPPVSKEFLKKLPGNQVKLYVYANEDFSQPTKFEGRAPEFQKDIILLAMKERLNQDGIPFDDLTIEKPYAEININRNITQHKNWENVLLKKLKK